MGILRQPYTAEDIKSINNIALGIYDGLDDDLLRAMNYEPYEYPRKIPLVSTNEISENSVFPPLSQVSRIEGYKRNELIYNNRLKEALPGISKKLLVMQKYSAMKGLMVYLANPTTENYCRTITDAKLNFLYSSGIKINGTKSENNSDVEQIAKVVKNERIIQKIVVDISRFGEGIAIVGKDQKPKYVKPSNWFPVVDSEKDEVICHIIVDSYMAGKNKSYKRYLKVDYHFKGYYNRVIYEFNGTSIGKRVSSKQNIKTGIENDFAVIVFNNSLDTLNLFGSDDYTLILSQIEDLVVSSCVESFCVHKFHFPSFQGPANAAAKQKDGSMGFELSAFYGIGNGGSEIKQIDVNIDIDALIAHRDNLKRTIAMLTGMKGTINDNKENGYAESGTARELRYADDISTTNKIKTFIEVQIKELIVKEGIIEGKNIDINDVNIIWSPSIQMNQFDRAELAQMLLGNQQVKSRQAVYQEVYEKDADSALEEFNEYLVEKNNEKNVDNNSI